MWSRPGHETLTAKMPQVPIVFVCNRELPAIVPMTLRRGWVVRFDSDEAAGRRMDLVYLGMVSATIVGVALFLFGNDRVIEHRIVSALRRSPRLWWGALSDQFGFHSPTGSALIVHALAGLERRGLISSETGTVYAVGRPGEPDVPSEVQLWSLVAREPESTSDTAAS
jgi:hypothetical protein